jgi:hypothetical protein
VLSGFDSTLATGINDSGEVVGVAFVSANTSNQAGFKWTRQTGMRGIAGSASALAINPQGQIAGINLSLHAAIFGSRVATDLGTLGDFSVATTLNSKGHAAGYSPLVPGGPVHAFFYAGSMQDLGAFQPGDDTLASSMNDSDLVVGSDLTPLATAPMARVQAAPGIVADLEVIGLWRMGTRGRAIAHDAVIGSARPFIWSATTGMEDLNTLIPQDVICADHSKRDRPGRGYCRSGRRKWDSAWVHADTRAGPMSWDE